MVTQHSLLRPSQFQAIHPQIGQPNRRRSFVSCTHHEAPGRSVGRIRAHGKGPSSQWRCLESLENCLVLVFGFETFLLGTVVITAMQAHACY